MISEEQNQTHKTAWLDEHKLSNRERIFVLAYLETLNQSEAARRCGCPQASAANQGSLIMRKSKVAAAIADGRARIEIESQVTTEKVLQKLWTVANASPCDLTQVHNGACRYCHGLDHQWQWKTRREFDAAFRAALKEVFHRKEDEEKHNEIAVLASTLPDGENDFTATYPDLPSDAGGYGYRITAEANPDCPECSGLGQTYTRMTDTNNLDEAGRALFDGVKETQHGIEVKMQSRADAVDRLAKWLRLYSGREDGEEDPLVTLGQAIAEAAQAVPVVPDPEMADAVGEPLPDGPMPTAGFDLGQTGGEPWDEGDEEDVEP